MKILGLLCKIFVLILRFIYLPIKMLPVKNRVVMISRESNEVSFDFAEIKKEIELKNDDIEVIILCRKIEKSIFGAISYFFHILIQLYYFSTSKLAILDTYCVAASVLNHKKSLKIIQIWHSSAAIKKFGYQTINKKSGSDRHIAEALCMHRNYDYFTAPSIVTARFFSEGFNTDIDKSRIICLPRLKYIKSYSKRTADNILTEYPMLSQKQNVLYAPTFRKGKKISIDELVCNIDTNRYNLIIKLHPLEKDNIDVDKYQDVYFDSKFNTHQWLNVADKVITDYSAIGLEAMVAEKEVYFYVFDLEDYQSTTGLNVDFYQEEIKPFVFKNANEINNILSKKYNRESMIRFRDKYISSDVDNCVEIMTDFLLGLVKEE